MGKRFVKKVIALSAVVMLTAIAAVAADNDAASSGKIKGAAVEKPVREVFDMKEMMAAMFGSGGPGGVAGGPGVAGGAGATAAPAGAAAGAATGGPPATGSDENSASAVLVENGKYLKENSKTDIVSAGSVGDAYASGLKVKAEGGGVGGVYVKGAGSQYTLADATITVSGDSTGVEGGLNSGAASTDYGTLILRNVNITTDGKSRCATAATKYSTLKVYNSTLTSHGGAEASAAKTETAGGGRGVNNYSRTHCSMSNSYAYFYYSTIIANGWGALSTDGAEGFVYLEANNCKIRNTKTGYGTYADGACHDVFNNCDFDVVGTGAVIAGEADLTFRDTSVKSGGNFLMIHCVMGSYKEVSTLKVTGGEIACKEEGALVKSQNAILDFDRVALSSEKGVLVRSVVNDDTNATKTDGKKVYGIHASFRDMNVSGDIIHEDKARTMWVYLNDTTLTGAVQDACLVMDGTSRWTATADSTVTISGDIDPARIDAPKGVTITAVAGESRTITLPGGGMLVLKKS